MYTDRIKDGLQTALINISACKALELISARDKESPTNQMLAVLAETELLGIKRARTVVELLLNEVMTNSRVSDRNLGGELIPAESVGGTLVDTHTYRKIFKAGYEQAMKDVKRNSK